MGSDTQPRQVSVSVVLPVRNGVPDIQRQLAALADQVTDRPWELVVADNGSTDGTPALVESWRHRLPQLKIVDASGEPGVSLARNQGVRAAAGDFILHCDDDDRVRSDWVEAMARALETADVVGGALDLVSLNEQSEARMTEAELPHKPGHLPAGIGCNLAYRREVFDELGGFDTAYPPAGGGEDLHFCWAAQVAGFSFAYAPDAVVSRQLRRTLRAGLHQRYRYGVATARLTRLFAATALPSRPNSFRRRRAWQLLRSAPAMLVNSRQRRAYLEEIAFIVGRQVGHRRFRRLAPVKPAA